MALSTVCRAEKSCTNKTSVKNLQFITNAKPYQFTSYFCEKNDEDNFFSKPAILKIQAKDFNKSLKNVIGIEDMVHIGISEWHNKPALYYVNTEDYIEAHVPIIIMDNNLMVDCIYINRRVKNFIVTNYSYCGDLQIIENDFGESGIWRLFPLFYLESTSYFKLFSTKKNKNSKFNGFDAYNGNIDDISFYNRYSSLNDYILNKYTVVMENAEKEYRFKQSEIYQRIAERFNPDSFIGLDIVDSRGNIVFYDKKALSTLLNKSTIRKNIKLYIQSDKKPPSL